MRLLTGLGAIAAALVLGSGAAAVEPSSTTATAKAIAAGSDHSCAVTSVGAAKCWGLDDYTQLGNGKRTDVNPLPVSVSGLSAGVETITAGILHTCALVGGAAKCWGGNTEGQVGDGTTDAIRPAPVTVSGLTSGVSAISAGGVHTCALVGGGAKCWGFNGQGRLGDGSTTDRRTPVDVSGLTSGVQSISAGGDHTCALTTSGGVKCWGRNVYGQVGDGTHVNRLTPVDVSGLTSGVQAVVAGDDFSCALTTSGGVKCWGNNAFGALGNGTTTSHSTPVDVSGLTSGVSAVSAGGLVCALTTGGSVKCWGFDFPPQTKPVGVSGLSSGVQAIAAGDFHACALTTSGQVKCWRDNRYGQLGDGTTEFSEKPVTVVGFGSSSICVVPNIKLKTLAAAKRAIVKGRCRAGKIEYAFSAKVKKGHVISQDRPPGTRLNQGGKVSLLVSKGKAACVVPNLDRKTLAAAKKAIAKAGCRLGKVERDFFAYVPKGRVFEQTPNAGASFGKPQRVDLVLSKGTQKLGPPTVIGLSADGDRVAAHVVRASRDKSCHEILIRRRNGKPVTIAAGCTSQTDKPVDDFALAGTRVAWGAYDYGNHAYCYLMTATVARPRPVDTGFCPGEGGLFVGHFAGSGPVLVFNVWGEGAGVLRLVGTKTHELLDGPGKVTSVDAGRFAVREPSGAISVYRVTRKFIRRFPIVAATARLDGSTLVAREGNTLVPYDLATGNGGTARSLRGGKQADFGDVAAGIAVYTVKGTVHVLRLSDGKDVPLRVTRAERALAQIEPAGLFYASRTKVTFMPMGAVRALLR